ncbi:MAG: PrgI family protein [Patescibacteria group bacterium]
MEQYPIPQFIEVEGKIAFFISFRQFFYLVGAGVVCFILYFILPFFLFMLASLAIGLVAVVLAFVSVNGMPIINIILNSIGFATGTKDYTWKKKESPYPFKTIKRAQIRKIDEGPVLKAQTSRLKKTRTDVELRTK